MGDNVAQPMAHSVQPDRLCGAPESLVGSGVGSREADLSLYPESTHRDGRRGQAEEETRRLNQELERRVVECAALLEAANQELDSFSHSVSHDLRAPLRVIEGFSRILVEDHAAEFSPEARRHLERVRSGVRRMDSLVAGLLAFSRSSRQTMVRRRVSPAALVREALANLVGEQEGRHVEISLGDLPDCLADPTLLRQVFAHLLGNALKFTRLRQVAAIEVGWRREGREDVYFVRDNGVGFDMANAEHLFGLFQRLHRAEEYEGVGVGLAIVRRIIHRHGGRVGVEAAVGQGATFYFTLGAAGDPLCRQREGGQRGSPAVPWSLWISLWS